MAPVPLSTRTLPELAETAQLPAYDREKVTPGVVHVGVGGFHRAHQALYLDRLMAETGELEWGICGVGVLPGDRAMKEALDAQDCLYTLVERDGEAEGEEQVRVVGSIVEYLLAADDPEPVLERMAAPTTRIVSLTITEGGYADADAAADADGPPSAFGLIAEALRRRRDRGLAPFTVVSCDNLEGNGGLARASLTAFARARDAELADWIEAEVPCPSSMVDRITPATTDADRAQLAERHGIEDRWPVVCESFSQWVLEDAFSAGRPPLDAVGVQLVDDVEPYELMKLRLLNASHQALGYFGHLLGHRLVHDAAQDPMLRAFVAAYMEHEGTPTLAPVPGIDLDDYRRTLLERFSNAGVRDTLARLCAFSSDRIPAWLLPVVRHQLQADGEIGRSAAVVASWARYAEGVDEQGEPIEVVDQRRDEVMAHAARQHEEPIALLEIRDVFGDLIDAPRFTNAYTSALRSLHERGARATLEALQSAP